MVDTLITLADGDEAVHIGTGETVRCYSGLVAYLIPTGGGPRESQFRMDVLNPVEGLINGNQLPAVWVLKIKSHTSQPEAWKYSD